MTEDAELVLYFHYKNHKNNAMPTFFQDATGYTDKQIRSAYDELLQGQYVAIADKNGHFNSGSGEVNSTYQITLKGRRFIEKKYQLPESVT